MNGTPGVIVVPGDTWTRPFGCSMVTGSMQIQEPSSVRKNARLRSCPDMAYRPLQLPEKTIGLLRARDYMHRTNCY